MTNAFCKRCMTVLPSQTVGRPRKYCPGCAELTKNEMIAKYNRVKGRAIRLDKNKAPGHEELMAGTHCKGCKKQLTSFNRAGGLAGMAPYALCRPCDLGECA